MAIVQYNKLVRDRIPEIIEADGKTAVVDVLSDDSFLQKLNEKLKEELREYEESGSLDELADLQEVILAIAAVKGVSPDELDQLRQEKAIKRGAFEKKLMLVAIVEDEPS